MKRYEAWWKGGGPGNFRHTCSVEHGGSTSLVESPWTGRSVIVNDVELPEAVRAKVLEASGGSVWSGELELSETELFEVWKTCERTGRSAWR